MDGSGIAASAASATVGSKRGHQTAVSAAEAAAEALAQWLRVQFSAFLQALVESVAQSHVHTGDTEDADLGVAALSTLMHFCANACSRKSQRTSNGRLFCGDTLLWILREFLCVFTRGDVPEQPPRADCGGARGQAAASRMRNALSAVRSEYADEYDDVRMHCFLAVARIAGDAADGLAAGGGGVATVGSCPANAFLRTAVGFMTSITLPPSEATWAEATHASLVQTHWEPALPELYAAPATSAAAGSDGAKPSRAKLFNADDDSDDDSSSDDEPTRVAGKAAAAGHPGAAATAKPAAAAGSGSLSAPGSSGAAAKRKRAGASGSGSGAIQLPPPRRAPAAASSRGGVDDDEVGLFDITLGGSSGGAAPESSALGAAEAARPAPAAPSAAPFSQLSEQRRAFARAWLAVLRLAAAVTAFNRRAATAIASSASPDAAPAAEEASAAGVAGVFPPDVLRTVLLSLPTRVLPHLPGHQALLLADFLTECTDADGAAALLALESLFLLMQNHGLEYAGFYPRLYTLLCADAVHAKYRGRFFKLLDMFLASAALPAYLVAAFAKKAARLALGAATPFALFALPFIYNCMKRHPACAPLLHTEALEAATAAAAGGGGWPVSADPFRLDAAAPRDARALESSLWELCALATHQYPPVAYLARALLKGGPPARAEYDIAADYSSQVFARLAEAEFGRTVRKAGAVSTAVTPFAFTAPAPLFGASTAAAADDESAAFAGCSCLC